MDILGTNAERHVLIGVEIFVEVLDSCDNRLRQKNFISADKADIDLVVFGYEARTLKEVHLRGTDKARDKQIYGVIVKVLRGIHLLNEAVFHNDDTGTHRHSFDLVVGDVNKGGGKSRVELGNFRSHGSTELCVEVGQRLVEQEHFRFADDGTAECDTLTLTAGQSLGFSGKVIGNAEDFRRRLYFLVDDFLGYFTKLQAESHIVVNGHMRIQSVVLEDHGDVSVLGDDVVDEFSVDIQLARRNFLEARDHTKGRGFTAAGRSDQNDEFLVSDIEAEIKHGLYSRRIYLVDAFQQKS